MVALPVSEQRSDLVCQEFTIFFYSICGAYLQKDAYFKETLCGLFNHILHVRLRTSKVDVESSF